MKVLTAAEMRAVDRRTIELGIPGLVLMENAGLRVVEYLERRCRPLSAERVVVLCGKGNNGGDGLVVARQLLTRRLCRSLDVVLAAPPGEFRGDAAANWRMFLAVGGQAGLTIEPRLRAASLVVDALLGTGLSGPPTGRSAELIEEINTGFPAARAVSVDLPSGLGGGGMHVRPMATVTFTAPKPEHVLPPECDAVGELVVAPIGSPPELFENDAAIRLYLSGPEYFRELLRPRDRAAHKGDFGHALVAGGAAGKAGAAAMAGLAALRAGAGLVTVASEERATVTALAAELMTQPLAGWEGDYGVLACGPGLGLATDHAALARRLFTAAPQPLVLDADGLNALAGTDLKAGGALRVLTPHPGEMARLIGATTAAVQADRLGAARVCAAARNAVAVLKGQRTIIAFPDGRAFVNPTGTPAMATAGSGDILTGLITGLLAQFPAQAEAAILAAVWLHGRAGEFGAATLGEQSLIAGDLLRFLPRAMDEARNL